MKRIAIITGASSGMGKEFVYAIDKKYDCIDEIWLIARRRDILDEIREDINKPCLVVCEDITDSGFPQRFKKMLQQEKANIKLLINCAGYGIIGPVEDTALEVSLGMIHTNCTGLTAMIGMAIPYMMKKSRIINLASSAAFVPQPNFAIYAATKSYVLSLSRALNEELRNKEIYVTAVCPGPVATDFFRIAEDGHQRAWFKDLFMSEAKDVVEQALKDSVARKEISIYGNSMKAFYVITNLIPHKILIKLTNLFSNKNKEK